MKSFKFSLIMVNKYQHSLYEVIIYEVEYTDKMVKYLYFLISAVY
jgi:hypothetical protein